MSPLLVALVVTTAPAAPTGLEKALLEDAKDGTLTRFALLDAALIASGVPDERLASEAARARDALAPAIARAQTQRDDAARGRALLIALHETVFRTYGRTATDVAAVIRTGEYNCLSSAVLFVVAAEGLLQSPRAMVTPTHAFARVTADGQPIDVQTTQPHGFGTPLSEAQLRLVANADAAEPEDTRAPAEELPVLTLVAAIYSNRAVAQAQAGDLTAATVSVDRAARLGAGALKTRAAAWRTSLLNGAAARMVEQRRLDDALQLLQLGLEGADGRLRDLLTQNVATVHVHLAGAAAQRSDWAEALEHLAVAEKLGNASEALRALKARATGALATSEGSDARCVTAGDGAAECLAELALGLSKSKPAEALRHARRAWGLAPQRADTAEAMLYALDRLSAAETLAANCEGVEALLKEALPFAARVWGKTDDVTYNMGVCWGQLASKAFSAKRWEAAAAAYRRAGVHMGFAKVRRNLAVVDLHQGADLAEAGQCDAARPHLRRAAESEAAFEAEATQHLARCASARAGTAFAQKDYAAAVRELRLGLRDAPKDATMRKNLGAALGNLALEHLDAGRCDEARALVPELAAGKMAKAVADVKGKCP